MKDYPKKRTYEEYCAPDKMPKLGLAEAYIRVQPYVGLFPIEEGFKKGNMFPNLYDPYYYC